jgi:hypothetical protein
MEIGDRPGHAEQPVEAAGREAEPIHGVTQDTFALGPRAGDPAQGGRGEEGVPGRAARAGPVRLPFPGPPDPLADPPQRPC